MHADEHISRDKWRKHDRISTHTSEHTDERICIIILSLSYQSQIKRQINKTLVNTAPGEDLFPLYTNRLGFEMWAVLI